MFWYLQIQKALYLYSFRIGNMFIWTFFPTMADTTTSKNIDRSSWIICSLSELPTASVNKLQIGGHTNKARTICKQPVVAQIVKELSACYTARILIATFRTVRQWYLLWLQSIQHTPIILFPGQANKKCLVKLLRENFFTNRKKFRAVNTITSIRNVGNTTDICTVPSLTNRIHIYTELPWRPEFVYKFHCVQSVLL